MSETYKEVLRKLVRDGLTVLRDDGSTCKIVCLQAYPFTSLIQDNILGNKNNDVIVTIGPTRSLPRRMISGIPLFYENFYTVNVWVVNNYEDQSEAERLRIRAGIEIRELFEQNTPSQRVVDEKENDRILDGVTYLSTDFTISYETMSTFAGGYTPPTSITLPNTIANVLTDHNKTVHDALGLDHGVLASLGADHHTQYLNVTRHDLAARHSFLLGLDSNGKLILTQIGVKAADLADLWDKTTKIVTADIDAGEFNVANKLVKLDESADVPLAQIPFLNCSKLTSGILGVNRGGLGKALDPTWTNNYILVYKTASDKFEMEDKGTPATHASTHENGGGDEVALDSSQITSGTLALARIPAVDDARIPNLETLSYGGAFAVAQIPTITVAKISDIPGTIASILSDHNLANHPLSIIPTMDDAHIPLVETLSWVNPFAVGQIPSLNASKINAGNLDNARMPPNISVTTVAASTSVTANSMIFGGEGTEFPGSPTEGMTFYRTDLHKWYFYNGTTWDDLTAGGGSADFSSYAATITAGNEFVNVTHGLGFTPDINNITITPQSNMKGRSYWVSDVGAVTFRVNMDGPDIENKTLGCVVLHT